MRGNQRFIGNHRFLSPENLMSGINQFWCKNILGIIWRLIAGVKGRNITDRQKNIMMGINKRVIMLANNCEKFLLYTLLVGKKQNIKLRI